MPSSTMQPPSDTEADSPCPTPGRVLESIASPGRSVMNSLTYETSVRTSKIILAVALFQRLAIDLEPQG